MKARLLFLLFLLLLVPGRARAQDYAAAGRHFAAAQDAFEKKDYKRAAAEFQAAYDITRDPVLLYNIGESHERAGDVPRAIESYQAYLREQPQATDRKEVERRLAELSAKAQKGAAPAVPDVEGAAPAPAPKPTPPAPKPATTSVYRTAAWASVATAVALLTAGAVLGLGAQNRADELERRTTLRTGSGQPFMYTPAEDEMYTSLTSEGRAYNSAAIACFTVAGAVAVTSTVLFLLDWRRSRTAKSVPGEPARPLALRWSF